MADILSFPHKQPNFGNSSATNSGGADVSQAAQPIEDLECGPWTTRKLKIPTSTSGYLVIECFESAEGKRLKGSSKMEPEFRLSNLKIFVQNAFSLDELKVFPYYDNAYNDTDFMSYDFDYPKKGDFIVMVSLTLGGRTAEYKLWF